MVDYVIPSDNRPFEGKIADIIMMITENGKERSQAEFEQLFKAAGFQLTNIIATDCSLSIVDAQAM